ncbi:MAG: hypothetical protein ACJAT2_002566 [Bacteriovoracaceae bacterium]|jgi:hypothetical protein
MSILIVFKLLSYLLFFVEGEVLFESIESKTVAGGAVFNKVRLIQGPKKDIWLMKQSHHGKKSAKWDQVSIVVDKSFTPYKASFHQLDSKGIETEYKTSCFRCHPGGPRAIREKDKLSIKNKLIITKWNLLIKSYGEVRNIENNPFERKVPLIERPENAKIKLDLVSCQNCHGEGKQRAALTKSQALTIKHLVKTKQMPPWPFKLSLKEKAKLNRFIYGF